MLVTRIFLPGQNLHQMAISKMGANAKYLHNPSPTVVCEVAMAQIGTVG